MIKNRVPFLKRLTKTGCILGLIYLLAMVYILFLRSVGHTPGMVFNDVGYLQSATNFIPFHNWVILFSSPVITVGAVVKTLFSVVGNILLFIPAGVLLPVLFPALRKYGWFVVTIGLVVVAMECAQVFLTLGFGDIDDVICNLMGASTGFYLVEKIQWVKKLVRREALQPA